MPLNPPLVRPAHHTKHIPLLHYPFRHIAFHLTQLDNGATNGTGLWLGAQCLSLYLAALVENKSSFPNTNRPRAIELGSGIGLSVLALASMGWDIVATDLPDVISTVLAANVSRNRTHLPSGSGVIEVRVLDWTVPPDLWVWDDSDMIAFHDVQKPLVPAQQCPLVGPPFDLIISSDTLYSSDLVTPLLRAFHELCNISISASPEARSPPIYFCVERRDPGLVDRALLEAKNVWNFKAERVPHKKLTKAMEKGGARWEKGEWDDVEIWKLSFGRKSASGRSGGITK